MMKRLVSMLLLAAMSVSLMACGGNVADATTMRINLASEPEALDPALNSTVDGGSLIVNTFIGLNTYDKDGKLIGALASETSVSEDGTVYTFKLRESKWSNGDPVTAHDFVYSWNRLAKPETGADYSYLLDIVARNEDGSLKMETPDDYTLVVTLTSPATYFLDLTAFPNFYPVHQASVEAADPTGKNPGAWAHEAGFVCNGAYTLKAWNHNESMVYVKNENFYDAENVTMETLEFMLSADDTAVYAAYNSGALDFIDNVPNDEIQAVIGNKDFRIVDGLGVYYAGFNVNDPIFEGKTIDQANKMRRAISLMVDRSYIAEMIGQTGQVPADTFVPLSMADGNGGIFNTEDDKWSYYDADKTGAAMAEEAIKLLEEAGYTFTKKSDGSYKCSPALSMTYLTNEGTANEAVAQTIQMDLARIGIDMKIQVQEWNVFLENRKSGNFTMARQGWMADYNDPINMLELFTSVSGNNDSQLGKNPKPYAPEWKAYDALINEIRTTADSAKRVELMHQAEDMLMETGAVVPIYYYNDIYMQREYLDGVYSTIYGLKYFMYATKS